MAAKMDKVCVVCSKSFQTNRSWQIACSRQCARIRRPNQYVRTPRNHIPTSTVGAISELLVACDLMNKGYEVFRSLSASCSCDLAILKNGRLIRIEVRTGCKTITGAIYFPKNKIDGKTDHYGVVVDSQIHYFPELSVLD